jgi:activator of HSP90 ATPase
VDGWPEGHFSLATFAFAPLDGKTRLTFTQTGVPEHDHEDIKQGWYDYYLNPMKEMEK